MTGYIFFLLLSNFSLSQEVSVGASEAPLQQEVPPAEKRYKKILVTDDVEDFVANPATPHKISKEKLDLYKYTDVNRALKQTAGAYVREEDGQGLRPNIGLRGTNPDRSKKVVILEDGILAGPSPYAAPAAYFTPSMNHTSSLEIYKGFTAVPFGPNSIGGSINYLSLDIPATFTPKLEASMGAFNTQNYRASIGDNTGALGYIVQVSRLSSDGFKQLDNSETSGFEKNEVSVKLRKSLGSGHTLEARLGYSDEDSEETYLGLSLADIAQSPYRRYNSSALDEMQWQRTKVELQHTWQISESSQIKTNLYRHDFEREWNRLDGFRKVTFAGPPTLFDVLNNPQDFPLQYQILSGQANSQDAGVSGAGDLSILANQRTYYSQGLQTQWNGQFDLGPTSHDIEVGLRYHQDQIRRDHTERIYQMTNNQLIATNLTPEQKDMNSLTASAVTLHFLENMKLGSFVTTLLGRVERVRFQFDDALQNQNINREDTVFAPGLGLMYNFNNQWSLKGSVNRGVSVAGLDDRGNEAQEESMNYEMGLKYVSQDLSRQIEVVTFYNDYSNITGTCSSSTGCSNAQLGLEFNGGRAAIYGLEGRVAQSFELGPVYLPLQMNLTFLNAEFKNDFSSRTAEWGLGQVNKGDPLPYIPQVQYTITVGAEYKKFKNEFAFIYQYDSYDQSVNENRLQIPAYGIVDWTGRYDLNKQTQIFARVDNLLSKDYIVSYKPFGSRPGKPQSFMLGLSYVF